MNEFLFGYRFLLMLLVLGLNAFFAAAEVALVSVRRSRLVELAKEDVLGARAALSLLENPERLLSVTQVGVTLASLGLGWAGEDTLYAVIIAALRPAITPATEMVLHGLSFTIAFLLISFAHVVIGEVVPKNLALDKSDRLAVIVAPALLVFLRVSAPFVFVIERAAAGLSRLLGLRAATTAGGHSSEELKFIVSTSLSEGHLEQFEEASIRRLLELKNIAARQIMVPRNHIVSVALGATLDHVLKVMNVTQYSRLPVYEDKPENIIGMAHYKDLVRVWFERHEARQAGRASAGFQLRRILRKPLVVPETKALHELLDEFRREHKHMALVVDEFGTISGLLTIEDVIEQVFGEIEDEHDARRPRPTGEQLVLEIDGTVNIRDLEMQYGIDLPTDAGFETLAGFLLFKFGYIPKSGEVAEHGGRRFTVLAMDRNRIARVRVERISEPQPSPA